MANLMKELRTTHELEVVVRKKKKGTGALTDDLIYSKDESGVIGSTDETTTIATTKKYLVHLRAKKRLLTKSKKLLHSLKVDLMKEIKEINQQLGYKTK